MKATWLSLYLVVLLPSLAQAGVIVGNGDDGADLEGAVPITQGPILEARAKARELVEKVGVRGIRTLGTLDDEIQKSALYLAPSDRQANLPQDQGAFHADMRGLVYARTQPSAHASTRFYPAAQGLNSDQLVALHVHEALHRALPVDFREDEAKVSEITLAITAPGATRDQVEQTIDRLIPNRSPAPYDSDAAADLAAAGDPAFGVFDTPNSVGYSLRGFFKSGQTSALSPTRMHSFHSHLYPFGGRRSPFGMGIEMAFIESGNPGGGNSFLSGPLGISARLRVWSVRSFDIGIWGAAHLNTLSADEMKNSPFGRDIGTLGISMRKAFKFGYVENLVSISTGGSSTQTIGLVDYLYDYGSVIQAKIRAGVKIGPMSVGGYGEIHLADHFRVKGGAFSYDSGRYRILSAGPEMAFSFENIEIGMQGRFLVGATQSANFDYLGNLMGVGTAQGGLGASASILF